MEQRGRPSHFKITDLRDGKQRFGIDDHYSQRGRLAVKSQVISVGVTFSIND